MKQITKRISYKIFVISPSRGFLFQLLLMLLFGACFTLSGNRTAYAEALSSKKRLLLLHSYHHGFTWSDKITKGVKSAFLENGGEIELVFEFMDTRRIATEQYLSKLNELYGVKYGEKSIDVLICSDDHALNFVLGIGRELFPDTPIVFCSVSGFVPSMRKNRQITGLQENIDIAKTLEVALRLHPNTAQIAVITDRTRTGRALKEKAQKIFRNYEKHIQFTYLENSTIDELKDMVSQLPDDAIAFLFIFNRDRSGRVLSHEENLRILSKHCNVPIYAVWDFYLGNGIVGGMLTSGEAEGRKVGEIALRILGGEKASDIPLAISPTQYKFDYRQLERFGIKESALPEGSIIIEKPFSFYETYKTLIWAVVSVIVLLSIMVFVFVGNIILRKRVENELSQSKELLDSVINGIADPIFVKNEEHCWILLNDALNKMFGHTRAEMLGKSDYDFFPREQADVFWAHDDMVMASDKVDINEEEITGVEGKRTISTVKTSFTNPITGRRNLVGTIRDITDRKQAEEENRQLEARLQRAEKMEAIGTLAGGVAHDLNNILSGLVSYPDLMLMDLPEDSPLREPILIIQNSGKKAAAIVQDLLTLARRGVGETEVTNPNDVISEYLKSPEHEKLRGFYPDVQIETDLEAELLNVTGSPAHLSKTVMNLVSNAFEAVSGKGLIAISTTNEYVDRPIGGYDEVKEGDYVVLTVADNGIGISPTDLERIFEPFYTKKAMGRSGTGLGMAVVWGTVKDHHGYIDIESTEGKGSVFRLYFPATREETGKEESLKTLEAYMGRGQRILVVDDVEEQRLIATMLLTKMGYTVDAVSSGEEAVEYMKTESADLLVLDMIMEPGIDGLDTYKKILELHPAQKAVVASGFSETDRVKEAQKLGAGEYIKKPYTMERIGLAVKAELS